MKERFCGRLKIELESNGLVSDGEIENLSFRAMVFVDDRSWEFEDVQVQTDVETEEAYDIAASGAVHYATLFTESHDGPRPDWAPPEDFCQDANDMIDFDDRGYRIRREVDGPTTYSG